MNDWVAEFFARAGGADRAKQLPAWALLAWAWPRMARVKEA